MKELTARQQKFAEYRLSGYPPTISARLAGYRDNGKSGIRVLAHRLERHEGVQDAIEKMRHAICYETLKRLQSGRKVSDDAHAMLLDWEGLTPRQRERLQERRERELRRREARQRARQFRELLNSF